jgi:hypothetical protein
VASEEEELLLDVPVRSSGVDPDVRKRGALGAGTTDEDCWASMSEAVPAIRKLNAATRHAIPKKLRLVFIVFATPFCCEKVLRLC